MSERKLDIIREYFQNVSAADYVDIVFERAGVEEVVMTNDPFDAQEHSRYMSEDGIDDSRFKTALRLDCLLNTFETAREKLTGWGFPVESGFTKTTKVEITRFLRSWIERLEPLYMAVSLPPDFQYPDDSVRGRIIEECVLPVSREANVPFALMIGVKKKTNPELGLAGDSVGKADIGAVERLCAANPGNKFLITMLSRENQHELCVAARKFQNLMVFGCWWFTNNPSIIEEMTRERIELLGTSFIPQHSDARVLDQLLYKWRHSRSIIAEVLAGKYAETLADRLAHSRGRHRARCKKPVLR